MALQASGALYQPIALPKSSRRGRWSVTAHIDPKAPPVGRVEFSVEDFVPEKLKVELTLRPADPASRPGQRLCRAGRLPLRRAGLGPHGRGRHARHHRRPALRRLRANTASARRASARSSSRPSSPSTAPDTDETGKSRLEWGGDQVKDTVLPLRAQLQARVFEPGGGRATRDRKDACRCAPARSISASVRPSRAAIAARAPPPSSTSWRVDAAGKQVARPAVRVPDRAHRL